MNHPNIAIIHGLEITVTNAPAIVMELVEGPTLQDRLNQGALPLNDILPIARQIAEALDAAHEKGVVHRDLKPANVKVREDGTVKVLDFGLAKRIPSPRALPADTTATLGPSVSGQILGTAAYMSPEQILGQEVDRRSDLFALGIILYQMLAGQHPWPRKSQVDTLHALLHDDAPSLLAGSVARSGLIAVVQKLLRKNAAERYPTAAAVLEALANATARDSADRKAAARDRASSGRPRRVSRKRIRSLAVLPLADLSPDPEHDYFADGMTDALITTLAQIGALRVISRMSVMRYKNAPKPLREIASELNVEAVLEGTVLRSASRVRISAQLIDTSADAHLWAKSYEGDLHDILAVQNQVAQAVAQEIQITLTPQERARLSAARPVDPEAYEAFLKSRSYFYRRTADAMNKSLEYLQRALAKDPTYALAHAGVANDYVSLGWDLLAGLPPAEAFPKAKVSAQRALALDPNCAEAYAALGWAAAAYDWDWVAAETAFRRALDLKPQYDIAHIWYSHFLHAIGRTGESYKQSLRALECDPLGLILNVHLGWHHLYDREYERAIEQLRKTIEFEPSFVLARHFLGEAYEQTGRFGEAIAEFEIAVSLSGRHPCFLAGLGHAYAASGQRERALNTIGELEQLSGQKYVPARGVAEIYIGLGDKQNAFAWLDKALEQRNGWLLRQPPFRSSLCGRRAPHRTALDFPDRSWSGSLAAHQGLETALRKRRIWVPS
jgi:serine/threonine protein kinase/Flp pilus assembly protein TadD